VIGEARGSRRWEAGLFDLDGTLIDTRPGVRAAISAAFLDVTGNGSAGEDADLSLPLAEMIRSVDPTASASRQRLLSEAFRRHYDSAHWRSADVYRGADHALQALRDGGLRVFVVTNKRAAAAVRLLEHFGLAHHFEAIVGQPDSGDPIPKAVLMSQCMVSAHLDVATTVLVGDSDQDAAAARSSGMAFVAVTSGAGPLGHATAGEERVEVGSLEDASAFVLGRSRGEDLES
jgi:phosphoglycolate phosphatase